MVTTDGGAAAAPVPVGGPAALVLSILGAGIAVLDEDGGLAGADTRFLALHGLEHGGGQESSASSHPGWPATVLEQGSTLCAADRSRLARAWSALVDGAGQRRGARALVDLEDGRVVELGASAADDRSTVLVAREATAPGDRFGGPLHEVNNAMSAILAHLHLALLDIEADHPARTWLEAVNRSAVELREHVRNVTGGNMAARRGREISAAAAFAQPTPACVRNPLR